MVLVPYAFSTSQKTGAEPFSIPVTFDRQAAFGKYCPTGMVGTVSNARN
jgi:hypothetical protein